MKKKPYISLAQLATIYLKIGALSFGGWPTTILLIEKELITNRKVLSDSELKLATATSQALPGPTQIILAAQTAYYIRGLTGAIIAIITYLLPSLFITLIFSALYFKYSLAIADLEKYTFGLRAAVGGIIIGSAFRVGRSHASNSKFWLIISLAALICIVFNPPTILVIIGFGVTGLLVATTREKMHGQ